MSDRPTDGDVAGSDELGHPPGSAADEVVEPNEAPPLTVEDLVDSLEQVTVERDGYLDTLRRLQAEFENYRKAVAKREFDAKERANEVLVSELLPVLDACDSAVTNGAADVALVQNALVDLLTKQGLSRLVPDGEGFDPEQHEAVMHEPADEGADEPVGPVVSQVLRVGYQWKGRTIRAAMVKVKG
ncbi:MAG: nucleotide exchange factor GrpE [Actinomycetota bacterium]|nr:nucleotide exchange factor GrpE [Actinomycetota bacterium]